MDSPQAKPNDLCSLEPWPVGKTLLGADLDQMNAAGKIERVVDGETLADELALRDKENLRVWSFEGEEWVVASSGDDAIMVATGGTYGSPEAALASGDVFRPTALDPDDILGGTFDGPEDIPSWMITDGAVPFRYLDTAKSHGIRVKAKASEWVQSGRGPLLSTHW